MILILLFSLLGCTQQVIERRIIPDDGSSSQGQKTLNFMGHWMTEHDREKLVHEVKEKFEKTNSEIIIGVKSTS